MMIAINADLLTEVKRAADWYRRQADEAVARSRVEGPNPPWPRPCKDCLETWKEEQDERSAGGLAAHR